MDEGLLSVNTVSVTSTSGLGATCVHRSPAVTLADEGMTLLLTPVLCTEVPAALLSNGASSSRCRCESRPVAGGMCLGRG